jgi:DnaJ-class molecular chaperone
MLRIPPGTQPGRKFRIKGQGIPKGDRRGDQLVAISVSLPEKLTAEAEEALREFAAKAGMGH